MFGWMRRRAEPSCSGPVHMLNAAMVCRQVHGNRSSPSKSTYSVLSVVQEEEERQLLEGMRRFRKNNAS